MKHDQERFRRIVCEGASCSGDQLVWCGLQRAQIVLVSSRTLIRHCVELEMDLIDAACKIDSQGCAVRDRSCARKKSSGQTEVE